MKEFYNFLFVPADAISGISISGSATVLRKFHKFLIVFMCWAVSVQAGHAQGVTAIYTDYNGYWTSSSSSNNPVKPDNSHNMLAFTWNGTTYSTGVNDAVLVSNSVSFTPLNFRAFPINSVPSTAGGFYFVMLGQLYDGINAGADNSSTSPFPANPSGAQLAGFLTDGIKGLDLGTGLANIPGGSTLRFNLSTNGITAAAVNDGIPDVFVTQLASPSSTTPDVLQFVDVNGNVVGNPVSITTTSLPVVGKWQADFYDLTSTQLNSTYVNGERPMAFFAADLGTFGITAANYQNAVALEYKPNGTSDPGFIAFNEPAISVATQLTLSTSPTGYQSNVTLSPAPVVQVRDGLGQPIQQANIPVTVSVASGGGTVTGTVTVNTDASGVATFSDVQLLASGTQTLRFSSASLNAVVTGDIIDNTTLPLTWLSFTARRQGQTVILDWETAGEKAVMDFAVQHSTNGSQWQTIGTIPAAANAGDRHAYTFTDESPSGGNNYYRLWQRDLDGRGTFSSVVSISLTGLRQLHLYPNPVTNGQLLVQQDAHTMLTIYNTMGLRVWQQHINPGSTRIEVSRLPAGLYRVKAGDQSASIVIQ
jgi:hypothetical protein